MKKLLLTLLFLSFTPILQGLERFFKSTPEVSLKVTTEAAEYAAREAEDAAKRQAMKGLGRGTVPGYDEVSAEEQEMFDEMAYDSLKARGRLPIATPAMGKISPASAKPTPAAIASTPAAKSTPEINIPEVLKKLSAQLKTEILSQVDDILAKYTTWEQGKNSAAEEIRRLVASSSDIRQLIKDDPTVSFEIAIKLNDHFKELGYINSLHNAQEMLPLTPAEAQIELLPALYSGGSGRIGSLLDVGAKPTGPHLVITTDRFLGEEDLATITKLLKAGARPEDAPQALINAFFNTGPSSTAVFSKLLEGGGYKALDTPTASGLRLASAVQMSAMGDHTPQITRDKIPIYNAAKAKVTAAQSSLEQAVKTVKDDDLLPGLAHIMTAINQGGSLKKVNSAALETLMQNLWQSNKPESAQFLGTLLNNGATLSWSLYGKAKLAGLSKDPLTQAKLQIIDLHNKGLLKK